MINVEAHAAHRVAKHTTLTRNKMISRCSRTPQPWSYTGTTFAKNETLRPTIMGKNVFGLYELWFQGHIHPFYSAGQSNADRLKIHPIVFRGLSGALLRFLGSLFDFRRSQSLFSGGLSSSEIWPKIVDLG